jgi:hypothetical protein
LWCGADDLSTLGTKMIEAIGYISFGILIGLIPRICDALIIVLESKNKDKNEGR